MTNTEMKLYRSEAALVQLEVLVGNETVWLSQKQMSHLYGTAVPAISKHIKNIFESGELQEEATVSKMEIVQQEGNRTISRPTIIYNMDMIIAVGYRVNSRQATDFRIWATSVLKEYLYRGVAFYNRMDKIEHQVNELSNQVQSLVQTALPPKQGVFCNGEIFDAYHFVSDLIRSANTSIVLFDNYADDSVLTQLAKRTNGVSARIGVNHLTDGLRLDVARHNRQYPPVQVFENTSIHDRFLLLDDTRLYNFGASFKDLGKKLFCFSLIESPEVVSTVRNMIV